MIADDIERIKVDIECFNFEPNDEITRKALSITLNRDFKDWVFICNEENNGSDVLDRNELIVNGFHVAGAEFTFRVKPSGTFKPDLVVEEML